MRGFMLLSLVSLALGAPQSSTYPIRLRQAHLEYGPPKDSTTNFMSDLQMAMDFQAVNFEPSDLITNSIEQPTSDIPSIQYLPSQIPVAPASLQTPFETTNFQFNPQKTDVKPIISKRFFLHSAPEEEEESVQPKFITVGKPRKNYNIVFIKSPAKSNQHSSIKIIPAQNEERTVIYVLSKKSDATEIDTQILEPITTTAKPEVFFIKYKTKEEAEHAQHTIQSQYDALGGSFDISDEGVAPVTSVVGSLNGAGVKNETPILSDGNNFAQEQQISQEFSHNHQLDDLFTTNTNNGYLPPDRKY